MKTKSIHNATVRQQTKFDVRLFDASVLKSEAAIESAFRVLENYLDTSAHDIGPLLDEFIDAPGLIAFIMSCA